MRRWFPRLRTLQAQILVALIVLGILPLGMVGLGVAALDSEAIVRQSARELTGLAQGLAGQVNAQLAAVQSESQVIAALPEVAGMDARRQAPLLRELYLQHAGFARLGSFDLAGRPVASSHQDADPLVGASESYRTAVRRGVQHWEVARAAETGRASLLVHTPIRDGAGSVAGVLRAVVDLESLSATLGRVAIGDGGRAFVLDAAGRVVLHPDGAAVQEFRDYAGLGIPFGGRLASSGTLRYDLDGSAHIAGHAPVPNVNWVVVVQSPEAGILAPAETSWRLALSGLVGSALLAALGAVGLSRALARPVHELAAAAHAFKNGDPGAPLPRAGHASGEIRMLVDAFGAMREAVASALARTRDGEERFKRLAENATDVIAILDRDGTIGYVSSSVERVLGHPAETLVGRNALDVVLAEDREATLRALRRSAAGPSEDVGAEARLLHADGSRRAFEVILKNLLADDAVGGIVATYRDVSERKDFERRLSHLAFHDPLTNLPNRALFADRLGHSLTRSRAGSTAVLFLDLDNFKLVNDTLGHRAGDRLLVGVAERLRACVRAADTVARLGGDEFTVLMEDIPASSVAIRLAERIVAALRAPFELDGQEIFAEASIGIALSDPGGTSAEDLLRHADLAMYRAKAAGKGRHALFDASMGEELGERLALEAALRRAIERDELRVHYQPIVRLETGTIGEVEALVRWEHPERGLVPPAEFIPLAEESGIIVPLGRWVLEHACRQVRAWQLEQPTLPPLGLSVNLSPRQFQDPHLLADVRAALDRTGLDPRYLKLEITETLILEDTDATLAVVHALRELGVRLAVDDFGTGNSALSYLKRFPIDTLKIDKSFIEGLGRQREDTAIVHAVVAFAKALDVRVTAEGIETTEQLGRLRELACDHGQGYYFAEPQPPEAIGILLAERRAAHEAKARVA